MTYLILTKGNYTCCMLWDARESYKHYSDAGYKTILLKTEK
jgi:hypothetical protein